MTGPATEAVHTCKNCSNQFVGKYCNRCGEKVVTDHDKSILHLAEENLHFLTHFEGSFFNSLKAILTAPGRFSLHYTNGMRKRYFKPVSFFLMLVILYLLLPFFRGLNMPLQNHLDGTLYSGVSQKMAAPKFDRYLAEHKDSTVAFTQLSESFAKKSDKTSKVLLFLIIPFSALPLYLLFRKKNPYFHDHLILATEINSFFLLFIFFILGGLMALLSMFIPAIDHLPVFGILFGVVAYSIFALFCYKAFARFYRPKAFSNILSVLLFLAWHSLTVFIIYKFILFVTVMMLI